MGLADYEERFPGLVHLATHVASRIVWDREDAADVGVETMARAYQRWARIESYADPWVVRTATNLAIDNVRRRRPSAAPALSPAAAVDDDVVSNEVVTAMLRRLTRRQRESIVLTVLCGYTAEQVGETLGISPSSVKTHVRRGLAVLRRAHIINEQEATQWLTTT